MKKSQLRKIIKESIKQLMTEQGSGISCCQMSVRQCNSSGHSGGSWYQPNTNGACPQVGDVIQVTNGATWQTSGPAFIMGVQRTTSHAGQGCGEVGTPGGFARTYNPLPGSTPCIRCCQWTTGFGGPSGACTLNCGSTSAGSCNTAAWTGYGNFTTNFTNTVNNLIAVGPTPYPKPCNFLNNKIAQFTSGLGGGGAANVLQCKLDFATNLHTQNNC